MYTLLHHITGSYTLPFRACSAGAGLHLFNTDSRSAFPKGSGSSGSQPKRCKQTWLTHAWARTLTKKTVLESWSLTSEASCQGQASGSGDLREPWLIAGVPLSGCHGKRPALRALLRPPELPSCLCPGPFPFLVAFVGSGSHAAPRRRAPKALAA